MKKSIVFAYWKDNQLLGFRQDTFNTIGESPKIYTYSKEQVETVLNNVKGGCNKAGTSFMKTLFNQENVVCNQKEDAFSLVSSTEKKFREWGEFEVRVHPFLDRDENYNYPEKWKMDVEIKNLQDAIEVHKFKIMENEN